MAIFLTNPLNYFFVIDCAISIPACIELDCRQHDNEEQMIHFVAEQLELDPVELYGSEFNLRKLDDRYEMSDLRSLYGPVELNEGQSIEHWIANYTL